jgi:arylsulfatase A
MRQYITLFLSLLLAPLFAQQKPNIIYIYADDLGYGELGCYGQEKIKTPNIDRMAAEGMRFTQHYTGAPVCAPSRCMLLTGKHAGHAYIRGNYELGGFTDDKEGGQMPLPEGIMTLPKLLKNAGYTTGCVGKWGLGMAGSTGEPNRQGFDYFYGYLDQKQSHNYYPTHLWENGQWDSLDNEFVMVHQRLPDTVAATQADFDRFMGKEYAMDKLAEKALYFIDNNKEQSFFLYLPLPTPHLALQAPQPIVENYMDLWEDPPYLGDKGYCPNQYPRATYAAMIDYLDAIVGLLLRTVEDLNLDNNTLIMFSSDNGPTFEVGGADTEFFNSTAGLRGRKMDLWEGGIRVPFIARWTGMIAPNGISPLLSAQYDMLATLTNVAGVEAPETDGVSLLPTLLGTGAAQFSKGFLYFEFPEKGGQVAVRIGNWKGVKSNIRTDKNSPWEIFDLSADPAETTNIAEQHPELVEQMETILKREHQSSHIREWEFLNPKFD